MTQRNTQDRPEPTPADLAEKRARNAARMRVVRAAARRRRDALRSAPMAPPATIARHWT